MENRESRSPGEEPENRLDPETKEKIRGIFEGLMSDPNGEQKIDEALIKAGITKDQVEQFNRDEDEDFKTELDIVAQKIKLRRGDIPPSKN